VEALPDTLAVSVTNGRVYDALIRCYGGDIEGARTLWKNKLLPRALSLLGGSSGAFRETAEKSLEALMFVAGSARRPDVGLEIASTVRKRKWAIQQREKIARAYTSGIRNSKVILHKSEMMKPILSNLLDSGLERSIEAELGVLLNEKKNANFKSLPRIRFQFDKDVKTYTK